MGKLSEHDTEHRRLDVKCSVSEEDPNLSYQAQTILLQSLEKFGRRPSLEFCGNVFRHVYPIMAYSVRMAFEGRSAASGTPPEWLRRASDVRILGFAEQGGDTLLELEAQPLGEAAEVLYRQRPLWNDLPAPEETAIHVMARVMNEVRAGNAESPLYDLGLLRVTHQLGPLFRRDVEAIRLPEAPGDSQLRSILDRTASMHAMELSHRTPSPRQVRLAGTLDMIRYSTRAFALKLKDGKEIHGVLDRSEMVDVLASHLNKKVLIVGKAVYRPSGTVLRIDAQHIQEDMGESDLFTRVPPPISQAPAVPRPRPMEQARSGVPAFFGIWPGDETDQELLASLQELRG